jgi:uncharacterized membrane protein
MKRFNFATMLGICALFATSAFADIRLCNKTGREIWATWGDISHGSFNKDNRAYGWYHLDPGQCKVPISGCVCNFAANFAGNCYWQYIFFAKDAFGATWSNGSDGHGPVCTTFNAFNEVPKTSGTCSAPRQWLEWGWGRYPNTVGGFCTYTFNFNP